MVESRKFSRPPTAEWDHLQAFAERFAKAAVSSASVDLAAYLPPVGQSVRAAVLHELIKIDLEIRWQRKQGLPLEDYQRRFPELGPLPALPAQLIYEEYRARRLFGDAPPLEQYHERFPDQFAELRRLLVTDPLPDELPQTRYPAESASPAGNDLATPRNTTPPTGPPLQAATLVPSRPATKKLAVGGYRLIQRIGKGAFGEVYRAEAPGGVEVAVKVIRGPLDKEEAQNELKALDIIKTLRHPCLLPTHAYWVEDDGIFVAMGLAAGSLRDRDKECRGQGLPGIPQDELLRYMREAAEGLDFANGRGVMHRDVKPENILLLQGHAQVADFGLARLSHNQRSLTDVTIGGTPVYMAPEVFHNRVSPRTDQYSLAATFVHLRLGRPLYSTRSLPELMHAHLHELPDLAPLPPAVQRVVLQALAKKPEDRFPSCREFVQALEEALAPLQPPAHAGAASVSGAGYRLRERIGRGAVGEVYRAQAPGGVEVAVKVIRGTIDSEETQHELEALEIIKTLRHPCLLPTHAYWVQEDGIYVAMGLAAGSLKDRDQECRDQGLPGIPLEELLRYTREAAEGLDYVFQARGVLHRDIKPENILLLQGHAQVADFGLARLSHTPGGVFNATFCGTPRYMAPEVFHKHACPQTDQYSLAATYATLRLGRPLFAAQDFASLMHEQLNARPRLEPLPPAEQKVLLKALAKEPEQRYPTCRAFAQALEEAVAPPKPARRRWLWLLLGLAACLLTGLATLALLPPRVHVPPLPKVALPEGYEPESGCEWVTLQGKQFPSAIDYVLPDGTRVPFLLIPERQGTDDPRTFYVMRDKVAIGLFQQFAAARPSDVQHQEWRKGPAVGDNNNLGLGNGRLPVMAVHVEDADRFARWLGGKLPSAREWDKAAGRFEDHPGEGPYAADWKPALDVDKNQIAIGRFDQGPLPVGMASKDHSRFGCRDMAGNGLEWTRDVAFPLEKQVPYADADDNTRVFLRSQSYAEETPFRFEDLKTPASESYRSAGHYIGFRVVLEP